VQWASTAPAIAEAVITSATDNLAVVQAKAPGSASLTATSGTVGSSPLLVTVSAPDGGVSPGGGEVRAIWVTRFAYNSATDVRGLIDRAASGGFNVVYFQIRGNGDAYYASALAPWAKKLTGTLGQNPGWDPLQTAIDQARLRGIQLHAYWNVFAAWPVPTGCATGGGCTCQPTQGQADSCLLPEASAAGAPQHWLRQHPESMAVNAAGKSVDGEYYWFSPGDAATRAHLLAVAVELLQKYDVDGLHLDRVRYPGQSYSYDPASNAAFAALPAPKPTREDWQRANVSAMVADLYAAVKQHRPKAVLSASVWGIYKVLPGCNTSQGFPQYYQDSLGWMKDGFECRAMPLVLLAAGLGCDDDFTTAIVPDRRC
jgi:uncharacterized lipoprotein YddW (UPF0748 family)